METISVITPLYNAKRFIPRLIETVQQQKDVLIEHIVVDDCSTDGSGIILEHYCAKYQNLRVIRLSKNSGPVEARNIAIQVATGRYLAFLDADDYWLPNKSKVQLEFMKRNPCPLSFTDYRFVSFDGKLIGNIVRGPNHINFFRHLMTRSGLGCLTVMIDRGICKNFLFLSTSPITERAEDFFAWGEIIREHGNALRVPNDLARYAVVQNSRSSDPRYKAGIVWIIYRKVYKLAYPVASICFLSFGLSAWIKRRYCRPRVSIEITDRDLGFDWLNLVKISS